jgi:hypothetical protein
MSITHDNSGARRTQAQRDAAALIERGEFIAADTPVGQAVIDALEETARRIKVRPFVAEPPKSVLPRSFILEAMRDAEVIAASGGSWESVKTSIDRGALFLAKRILDEAAPHGAQLVVVTISVQGFFGSAMLECNTYITFRAKKNEFLSAHIYGPEPLFDAIAPYHGMVSGRSASINH